LDNKIQIKLQVILCVPGQLPIQSRISLCTTNWMKQKNPLPVSAGHALSAQNEKSLNGVTVHISPQRAKHESQSDEQILSTLA